MSAIRFLRTPLITDLLRHFVNSGGVIAGGFPLSIMLYNRPFTDIDIFLTRDYPIKSFGPVRRQLLRAKYNVDVGDILESKYSSDVKHRRIQIFNERWEDIVTLQLIHKTDILGNAIYYQNLDEVLKSFDFNVSKVYLEERGSGFNARAYDEYCVGDLSNNSITVNRISGGTHNRLIKYIEEKKFTVDFKNMLKIYAGTAQKDRKIFIHRLRDVLSQTDSITLKREIGMFLTFVDTMSNKC